MPLAKSTLTALALAAATALAGAAQAGTMTQVPVESPVIAPEPPARFNWTGAYVGVGIGYGRATHFTFPPADPVFFPPSTGLTGSVLLGYTWQGSGSLVAGGELMLSAGRMRGAQPCPLAPLETCSSALNSLGAARLRIGLAQHRTLVFATLGVASASVRYSATDGALVDTASVRVSGWTAGLGVEHAMANGWNLRGDLEHYRFRPASFPFDGAVLSARTRANVVRLSLVRRF